MRLSSVVRLGSFLVAFFLVLNSRIALAVPFQDVSRLETVEVDSIARVREIEEIKSVVKAAAAEGKSVSISGARHSQGGHTYFPRAVVLDMRSFKRAIEFDASTNVITVESGATWEDVQNYAGKFGRAVKVMQASNIFTVGGSLSVNAHGRDPHYGSIYDREEVREKPEVGLHFAWPSIAKGRFFEEILIADYRKITPADPSIFEPLSEKLVWLNKTLFGLSRGSDFEKTVRWFLQKNLIGLHRAEVSRNNAMRPEVKFLDHDGTNDTDILQEYFFPVTRYEEYMARLREILLDREINVLSATLRYVPPASGPFLRYAGTNERFAIVLYLNQGLATDQVEKMRMATQAMVDLADAVGGTYYLPYQRYPTRAQLRRSYPAFDAFLKRKLHYDPRETFKNQFYEFYR